MGPNVITFLVFLIGLVDATVYVIFIKGNVGVPLAGLVLGLVLIVIVIIFVVLTLVVSVSMFFVVRVMLMLILYVFEVDSVDVNKSLVLRINEFDVNDDPYRNQQEQYAQRQDEPL